MTLGKLGRKICCEFKRDVQCILLVDGNKLCVFDETTEEQYTERGELQFGFCPLLPSSERNGLIASLMEEGFSHLRSFKGQLEMRYYELLLTCRLRIVWLLCVVRRASEASAAIFFIFKNYVYLSLRKCYN